MIRNVLIGLGLLGALFLWLSFAYAREHVKTHGIHKIVGRTLTGRPTHGKRHTNASFFRKSDGKTIGHPVGRVGKRHHRAGIANLARTLGWLTALCLTGYGLMHGFRLTVIGASVAFTAWLAYRIYRLVIRLRAWWIQRTYITPLAEALAPRLELTGPELEQSIVMEPGYQDKKTGPLGRIYLPTRFHVDGTAQDAINNLISSRLPVGADYTWKLKGNKPHILMTAAPPLPSMVKLLDYVKEIEALGPRQYIPGINRTGETYTASFAGEDPHHGYCWGSGRGKSTILKSIVSQVFHNEIPTDDSPGATGTVIDPKDISLDCLVGVPGLDFYNESEDFERDDIDEPGMWTGIRSVYGLMKSRYAELKLDPTKEFNTHLLIMEEANSFAIMSKIWWRKHKPKGGLVTPPIWEECIAPLFWRGRQANIFIVLVAQSIQERFLGNCNLRPSLGMLSLSGWKMSQWDTYVGTSPRIKPQRGKGRAIYIEGEQDTWTQTFYATDSEFRDFAMHGRRHLAEPTTEDVAKVTASRAGHPKSPLASEPVPTLTGTVVPKPRIPA
jgi:hypothetical protein